MDLEAEENTLQRRSIYPAQVMSELKQKTDCPTGTTRINLCDPELDHFKVKFKDGEGTKHEDIITQYALDGAVCEVSSNGYT